MSPDPDNAGGHENDPQSWNGYAYARNNPTTLTDPTGLVTEVCEQGSNGEQTNCGQLQNAAFRQFESENSELYFANGNIYANGNLVGTYKELSSDEDEKAQALAAAVSANHPGDFIATVAGLSIVGGGWVQAALGLASGAGWGTATTLGLVAGAVGTNPQVQRIASGLAPVAESPALQRVISTLYQTTDQLPGGTAGAVRWEQSTGELLSPSGHAIKAAEIINRLNRLLASGSLSPHDSEVARALIDDLKSALGGN
jgi:hypothetical protein